MIPAPSFPVTAIPSAQVPRAHGTGLIDVQYKNGKSALADLRMSGCLKVLFSRAPARVDAILVNTAGGLTSGDSLDCQVRVRRGATAAFTTQAAERAYRAADGPATVTTQLDISGGAQALWLPQELILFDGAKLDRTLTCALSSDARFLMVEPVVFGRAQMGERVRDLHFKDRIEINRDGAPLYRDVTHLTGDALRVLDRAATASGARAMASLFYAAPDAASHCARLARTLPQSAGATLLAEDIMVIRILAADGFDLRRALLPVLDQLSDNTLPISWRL